MTLEGSQIWGIDDLDRDPHAPAWQMQLREWWIRRDYLTARREFVEQMRRELPAGARVILMAISFGNWHVAQMLRQDPEIFNFIDHYIGICPAFGIARLLMQNQGSLMGWIFDKIPHPIIRNSLRYISLMNRDTSFVVPRKDEIVDVEATLEAYRRLEPASARKRILSLRDVRHNPFGPENRHPLALMEWINAAIHARPAPKNLPLGFEEWRGDFCSINERAGLSADLQVPVALPRPTRLREIVENLARAEVRPRDYLHPENLSRVADDIAAYLRQGGLTVEEQAFRFPENFAQRYPLTFTLRYGSPRKQRVQFEVPPAGTAYRNVIVKFSPTSRGVDASPLVFVAHYDAVGPSPGADDNGSGIACLMHLALKCKDLHLPIPVWMAFVPNEERPTGETEAQGSFQFLHHHCLARGIRPRGAIVLDTIGRFYDEHGTQAYPLRILRWLKPDRGNFAVFASSWENRGLIRQARWAFGSTTDFKIRAFYPPRWLGGNRLLDSDHNVFVEAGIPGFMITDTAEFRSAPRKASTYHTVNDSPQTLNYTAMAEIVSGLAGMLQNWPLP